MRYEGTLYRPPSEANSYILQATIGCSWNACVYCDMYRSKRYRVRDAEQSMQDILMAGQQLRGRVNKVFVADGDALAMTVEQWTPLLVALAEQLGPLKRVSCYATARNVLEKSDAELRSLAKAGLKRLYIGPESGDDVTLKRIAKGGTHAEHVEAAHKAHAAGMELSVIALLGAGGTARSDEHAARTAELVTAMDPAFFAALSLTIVPGTPLDTLHQRGKFELPSPVQMLGELHTIVRDARPTNALFRTNHASNYLPLAGRLPADGPRLAALIQGAIDGRVPLRPEHHRGL